MGDFSRFFFFSRNGNFYKIQISFHILTDEKESWWWSLIFEVNNGKEKLQQK